MPKQQDYSRAARGKYTQYNRVSAIPEGGVIEARNCVAERPGVLSKRRGFSRYGAELASPLEALFEYRNALIALDGGTLKYDSDGEGAWTAWDGLFDSPDGLHRMRSVEQSKNLFFTSNKGIFKTDSLENTPVAAGIPEALDIRLTSSGSAGWFESNSAVAYRIIWSREDDNDNLLLGAPSYKVEITNPRHFVALTNPSKGLVSVEDEDHGFDSGDIVDVVLTLSAGEEGYEYTAADVKLTVIDKDTYKYNLELDPLAPEDPEVTAAEKEAADERAAEETLFVTAAGAEAVADMEIGQEEVTEEVYNAARDDAEEAAREEFLLSKVAEDALAAEEAAAAEVARQAAYLMPETDGYVFLDRAQVEVEFSVPDGILPEKGDKYEIYRTKGTEVAPLRGDTGEEFFRVIHKKVTAAEVAAKKVIFEDKTVEVDLDDLRLYTSSTQETIGQRNDKPPYCKDMALFKGYLFTANLRFRGQLTVRLDETLAYDQVTGEPVMEEGDSLTINAGGHNRTYTLASKENIKRRKFLLSATESTPAANTRETIKSLVRVINQHPTDSELYAHYASLENDSPGKILLEARTTELPQFTVVASSAAFGAVFEEEIETTGDETKSDDGEMPNGLLYSKAYQPEAMPYFNSLSIGSKNHEIHRIIPLRDSLIILKEDGAYRLSGETANSFVVKDLDRTVTFTAPETAVAMNNAVFCLTTQGVVKIDENGTQAISWPVEKELLKAEFFPAQASVSFAVGYESSRNYILLMPPASGATLASKAWVFNYLTNEWTTWLKPFTCGFVTKRDDRLYFGSGNDHFVLQERKSLVGRDNLQDYMDETISVEVYDHGTTTDADGNTVTTIRLVAVNPPWTTGWEYPETVRAGFLFQAGKDSGTTVNKRSKVASATLVPSGPGAYASLVLEDDLELVESDPGTGTITEATLSLPIDSYIQFAPEDGESVLSMKHFTYAALSMEKDTALTHELGFYSDVVPQKEWVDTISLVGPTGWGEGKWGADAWGDFDVRATPIVSAVPRQHQRCRALTILYRHRTALEKFDLQAKSVTFRPYGGKIVRQSI